MRVECAAQESTTDDCGQGSNPDLWIQIESSALTFRPPHLPFLDKFGHSRIF